MKPEETKQSKSWGTEDTGPLGYTHKPDIPSMLQMVLTKVNIIDEKLNNILDTCCDKEN